MAWCIERPLGNCPAVSKEKISSQLNGLYEIVKNNPSGRISSEKIHDRSFRDKAIEELYQTVKDPMTAKARLEWTNQLPEHPFFKKLIKINEKREFDEIIKNMAISSLSIPDKMLLDEYPNFFNWLLNFYVVNSPIRVSSEPLSLKDLNPSVLSIIPPEFSDVKPTIIRESIFDRETKKHMHIDIVNYTNKNLYISPALEIYLEEKFLHTFSIYFRSQFEDYCKEFRLYPQDCQIVVFPYFGQIYISRKYLESKDETSGEHHICVKETDKCFRVLDSQRLYIEELIPKSMPHIINLLSKKFPEISITENDISIKEVLYCGPTASHYPFKITYLFSGTEYNIFYENGKDIEAYYEKDINP